MQSDHEVTAVLSFSQVCQIEKSFWLPVACNFNSKKAHFVLSDERGTSLKVNLVI